MVYGTQTIYASSLENPGYDTTDLTSVVGTVSTSYTPTNKGWECTITISASIGTKIKSLLFTRNLYSSSSAYSEAVIYAVKLDSAITIDSSGVAHLIFAIEF